MSQVSHSSSLGTHMPSLLPVCGQHLLHVTLQCRWEQDFELLVHEPEHQLYCWNTMPWTKMMTKLPVGRMFIPTDEPSGGEIQDRWLDMQLEPPGLGGQNSLLSLINSSDQCKPIWLGLTFELPCPALHCPAMPCPAQSRPVLPCPVQPCPALPCPALPFACIIRCHCQRHFYVWTASCDCA